MVSEVPPAGMKSTILTKGLCPGLEPFLLTAGCPAVHAVKYASLMFPLPPHLSLSRSLLLLRGLPPPRSARSYLHHSTPTDNAAANPECAHHADTLPE